MKKVLVVDDDRCIFYLLQKWLDPNKFSVITAENGEIGFNKVKAELPDIILMDVLMPKMSGLDAVKLINSDEETKNIPILFITGVFEEVTMTNELKNIIVDGKSYRTISKPLNEKDLLKAINETLAIS